MICEQWDVVVPFPFIDKGPTKRRPALVVSKQAFNKAGHAILAMKTTKAHPGWPGDSEIDQYPDAGLHTSCIVRLKIFTLDNRLILKKIGHLSQSDIMRVHRNMNAHLV